MSTITRANLVFNTCQNAKLRMNLPRATKAITSAEARAAMQRIIDSGAVLTASGTPTGIYSAKVVSTTREQLV